MPNDNVDMEAILNEIASKRHIIRYTIDDKKYIEIRNFLIYQKPHPNETPSKIPDRYGRINGKLIGKPLVNQEELKEGGESTTDDQNRGITGIVNIIGNVIGNVKLNPEKGVETEIPFDQNTFSILFGGWPEQIDPKFNEKKKDAEASFYRNINEDNYAAFERAWQKRLNLYNADKSKDRRYALGAFRTFCEGRWKDVDKLEEYSKLAPKFAGHIVEKFAELKE